MSELKSFNCVDSDLQEFCEPRLVYPKSEADKVIAELKEKADKLHSCLKCLVIRDLIKDCQEKKSAIEIVKEYKQ